jgi:tetratricopeptide (TPR) repeat protein
VDRYVAFISYSQRDRAQARWLHRKIETYRVPARLRSSAREFAGVPGKLSPVFLDREELSSSPDLAESVRAGLRGARHLIVICSPHAARSRWVNEEISYFRTLGDHRRILCLIVAGEPHASDKPDSAAQECFPPALLASGPDGRPAAEPLAADLRAGMDEPRDALLKIVAALLGLGFDNLRRREQARRQKRLAAVAAGLAAGCIALGGLAVAALVARNEAQRQRQLAEQQSLTAQRTAEFMKSLFEVSDPGEARGNSVTAREILDKGVRQIDSALDNEPLVRADLTTTLGEVYTNLGLYRAGSALLEKARGVSGQTARAQAHQALALGEAELLQGHYDKADALFANAVRLLDQPGNDEPFMLARALTGRGEMLNELERETEAVPLFQRSLALVTGSGRSEQALAARDIDGLAASAFHAGDLDQAGRQFRHALDIRVRLSGEQDAKVAETLMSLGAVEYMRGHNTEAERYFSRALPIYRHVLGEHHPDVGMTLNNLARIHMERRQFDTAKSMLQESADIMLEQKDETNDNMAFVYSNLALAHMETGDLAGAAPLYDKALRAAVANNHRLHGPILTDMADLDCRNSRFDDGLKRLDEARPIVAARYPNDAWRTALIDNVRAGCLLGLKRIAEAEPLLAASTPVLLQKWGKDGLYGADAVQRGIRFYTQANNPTKLAEFRALERR